MLEVAANDDEDDEATNERQKQLKKVVIDLTQQVNLLLHIANMYT